jgi:hypothetical protein
MSYIIKLDQSQAYKIADSDERGRNRPIDNAISVITGYPTKFVLADDGRISDSGSVVWWEVTCKNEQDAMYFKLVWL